MADLSYSVTEVVPVTTGAYPTQTRWVTWASTDVSQPGEAVYQTAVNQVAQVPGGGSTVSVRGVVLTNSYYGQPACIATGGEVKFGASAAVDVGEWYFCSNETAGQIAADHNTLGSGNNNQLVGFCTTQDTAGAAIRLLLVSPGVVHP